MCSATGARRSAPAPRADGAARLEEHQLYAARPSEEVQLHGDDFAHQRLNGAIIQAKDPAGIGMQQNRIVAGGDSVKPRARR